MDQVEKVHGMLQQGQAICTDSRLADNNSIFFALKGENFNGNKFAESAIRNGAKLAIVDDKRLRSKSKMLFVPEVLNFLQQLASHHRNKLKIPIIGLTGSNGKTTTKELLNYVLAIKHKTFATQGNLNNHIGVPLSLLSIEKSTEVGIIEMGANHIGEIYHLCSIAQPTHGLITNIGKAHLEGFGSFEGVIKAKSELYGYLSMVNGVAFINSNNETLTNLIQKHRVSQVISYGSDQIFVNGIDSSKSFLSFSIEVDGFTYSIKTQIVGDYNVENILAAICIGKYFGVDYQDAINAINEYIPTNNRSQFINTKKNDVILDAYNANPSSMELAIKNFSNLGSEKPKLAILGEMLELGKYAKDEHQRIVNLAKGSLKEIVFIGQHFVGLTGDSKWFASRHEFADYLKLHPLVGYTMLVKGSRGVELDKLLKYL